MTILYKKTLVAVVFALLCLTAHGQVERKVAVFDPAGRVNDDIKEIVREVISSVVVNTDGYEVLERRLIDRIFEENRFQAGGLVDDTQIVEMGRLLGANLAFVSSVNALGGNFFISGKIIDIQTARIEKQRTIETQNGTRDLVLIVQRLVEEMLRQPATQVAINPPRQQTHQEVRNPSQRTVTPAISQQTTVAQATRYPTASSNYFSEGKEITFYYPGQANNRAKYRVVVLQLDDKAIVRAYQSDGFRVIIKDPNPGPRTLAIYTIGLKNGREIIRSKRFRRINTSNQSYFRFKANTDLIR